MSGRRPFPAAWPGAAAAALLLAGVVAGCVDDRPTRLCPSVSILKDAEQAVLFRDGPGRDLTDVRYEVAVAGVTPACVSRADTLASTVTVDIVATRGPAADGPTGTFAFFVAVLDDQRNILNKEVFRTDVPFGAGQRRAGVREEIEQIIPIAEGQDGSGFEILVGLQLDPEQLRYNRQQRGR